MPESVQDLQINDLQVNKGDTRGRPRGRKNTHPRIERQEACRAVAQALIMEPTANLKRLSSMVFPVPDEQDDEAKEKAKNSTYMRAKRALDDLKRDPSLAGPEMAEKVRQALAVRKAEEEKQESMIPIRVAFRRITSDPEGRQALIGALRDMRENNPILWGVPLNGQITKVDVPHFRPECGGTAMTSREATWRAQAEIKIGQQTCNMVAIPYSFMREIITNLQEIQQMKKSLEKIKQKIEEKREKIKIKMKEALASAGYADPDLPACQYLESPEKRVAREEANLKEAGIYPIICGGVADLSLPDADEIEPWRGRPLDAPDGDCRGMEPVENDGVDPEVTEIFSATAVALAGGRRRGRGGAKTSPEERAVIAEGLHTVH